MAALTWNAAEPSDGSIYDAVGVQRGDRATSEPRALRNFDLFGASQVAIVTSERELSSYGVFDCGGFIQAFMLSAMRGE